MLVVPRSTKDVRLLGSLFTAQKLTFDTKTSHNVGNNVKGASLRVIDLDQDKEVAIKLTVDGQIRVLGRFELVQLLSGTTKPVADGDKPMSLQSLAKWLQTNRYVGSGRKSKLTKADNQQIIARLTGFKGTISSRSILKDKNYLPALKARPGASSDLKQAVDELLDRS